MFNRYIMKSAFKSTFILWLVITIVTMLPLILIMTTVDKQQVQTALFISFFLSFGLELPIVYLVFGASKLVANEVDKGYMSYFLSTPLSRTKILLSKMNYYNIMIFSSGLIWMTVCLILNNALKIEMNNNDLLINFLGLYLLMFALGSISFLASSVFNKNGWAIATSAAIAILFFLFFTLGVVADLKSVSFLKYLSLNTLYNAKTIKAAELSTWLWQYITLFGLGIVLYSTSIIVFKKRDLPL